MTAARTAIEPAGFGPWAPSLSAGERLARFRELRAVASMLCGFTHPLATALRDAETDTTAAVLALSRLEALPPLRRRRLLATYAALQLPRP